MYNNDTWNEISNYRYSNFEEARKYAVSRLPITSVAQRTYNELLTEKAREAVPFPDYCAMIARVMHVIGYYNEDETPYDNLSVSAIAENISYWANHKADKIIAMKACSAYNADEPYKLIIQANFERVKDEDTINRFSERYNDFLQVVIHRLHSPKISAEDISEYKTIKEQFTDRLDSPYYGEEKKELIRKWLASADNVNPHVGQKTSRFIRNLIVTVNGGLSEPLYKLITDIEYTSETTGNGSLVYIASTVVRREGYYDSKKISISQHEPFTNISDSEVERKILNAYWEKGFADYADAINPVVFTRPTVLSLDYVDYILMSHGSGWESCHWICKEDATAGGCNSGGTWSYANDYVSYIMYTTADDTTENYELAEKITREVVVFDEEKHELLCDRLYPQSNDSGCSSVYTEHRLYAQKMIAMIYGYSNLWNTFSFCGTQGGYADEELKEFPKCADVETGFHSCAYPDYRYFKSSVNVPKEILTAYHDGPAREMTDIGVNSRKLLIKYMHDKGDIEVGYTAICPICGTDIAYAGDTHFICSYCAESKTECAGCGYSYDDDNLHYCVDTEDYRCDDCCFYDDYSGEYYSNNCYTTEVYDKNDDFVEVPDSVLERAEYNGDVFQCEECGRYFWSRSYSYLGIEPQEDEDGTQYCPDCYKDVMVTCQECGCLVNKKNATKIEGEWYCDDCATMLLNDFEDKGEKLCQCSECRTYVRGSKTHIVYKHFGFIGEDREQTVCDDCYKNYVVKCAECGKEFLRGSMYTSMYEENGDYVHLCSDGCTRAHADKILKEKLNRWVHEQTDDNGYPCPDGNEYIHQLYNNVQSAVRCAFGSATDFKIHCVELMSECE